MSKFDSKYSKVKSTLPPVSGIKILMPTIEEMPVQTTMGTDDSEEPKTTVINTYKLTCEYCTKSFLRNDHLKRHVKNVHTITNCYLCPVCKGNCDTYKSFCNHLLSKHQTHSNFTCQNCDYDSESVSDFLSHFEDHLIAENYLHKCPQCDASFKRADHVKRHLKNIHNKKSSCLKCNEVFSSKINLTRHNVKVHRSNKPNKEKKKKNVKKSS